MGSVPHITARTVRSALPAIRLIDAIDQAFAEMEVYDVPERHHHEFDVPAERNATMLLMPAWKRGSRAGVKIANIFPGNPERGLPAVTSLYVLQSAVDGHILATIDGDELTRLRTAATSAVAARHLARQDARTLLMVGAGALAEPLIRAHSAVRPIESVLLWNRSRKRAVRLAESVDFPINVVDDLDDAARQADLISCATMSTEPLIRSGSVGSGTHIDLVGAYRPDMRESDSELVGRSSVFVDTRSGALAEAGDLLIPAGEGVFDPADICADLHELCADAHPGRRSPEDLTLFKSVGHALEDLVAASLVYDHAIAG